MGVDSKISWTDNTWNPWHGCIKVSTGCKYCYMYRDKERYGQDPTTVIRARRNGFNAPLRWEGHNLVFTCSWSDVFIEEADEWRKDFWDIIKRTPQHIYQILTKRPENIIDRLPEDWGVNGYENVWLGVSAENQAMAKERIPQLLKIPSKVHFVSFEPLLEYIHLKDIEGAEKIGWVIIGGESGNSIGKYRYRRCEPQWIEQLIRDCQERDIPIFVKQLGTHLQRVWKGVSSTGMSTWPKNMQIRQMPKYYKRTVYAH